MFPRALGLAISLGWASSSQKAWEATLGVSTHRARLRIINGHQSEAAKRGDFHSSRVVIVGLGAAGLAVARLAAVRGAIEALKGDTPLQNPLVTFAGGRFRH